MSIRSILRHVLLVSALLLALLVGFVGACTPARHILVTADPRALGPAASPDLFEGLPEAPEARREAWRARQADMMAELETTFYGAAPPAPDSINVLGERTIETELTPGDVRVLDIAITPAGQAPIEIELAIATPTDAPVRGVILAPNECGLSAAFRDPSMPPPQGFVPGYCEMDGWLADIIGSFFGEYISGPPADWLLERGYALVSWQEAHIAPDSAALHSQTLQRLGLDPNAPDRPGVISIWAWSLSRIADVLDRETSLSSAPYILYGHSRRGKAVLLAAARDERFAVTIAHQAGTGGSSLHRDGVGEPVSSITESYPHWFVPAYSAYGDDEGSLPTDQHALIALIAPRAVLLGGAWRDTWSDPAGGFRALQGASEAWAIEGAPGLLQTRLNAFDPAGRLANHIRGGTHGVTGEDWEAFLAFADAHTSEP